MGIKSHCFQPISLFISEMIQCRSYLLWNANWDRYACDLANGRMMLLSVTLSDPWPRFQGHAIIWRWIHLFNINRDLHTPYLMVSLRMTWVILSDRTRSLAQPVCGSWASCYFSFVVTQLEFVLLSDKWTLSEFNLRVSEVKDTVIELLNVQDEKTLNNCMRDR